MAGAGCPFSHRWQRFQRPKIVTKTGDILNRRAAVSRSGGSLVSLRLQISYFSEVHSRRGIGIHSDRARGPFLQVVANGVSISIFGLLACPFVRKGSACAGFLLLCCLWARPWHCLQPARARCGLRLRRPPFFSCSSDQAAGCGEPAPHSALLPVPGSVSFLYTAQIRTHSPIGCKIALPWTFASTCIRPVGKCSLKSRSKDGEAKAKFSRRSRAASATFIPNLLASQHLSRTGSRAWDGRVGFLRLVDGLSFSTGEAARA